MRSESYLLLGVLLLSIGVFGFFVTGIAVFVVGLLLVVGDRIPAR